jgi:hypothetical protein
MRYMSLLINDESWAGIRNDIVKKGNWLENSRVKACGDGHREVVLDERRRGC